MKLCDICGTRHESYQGHVFATNATNTSATNRADEDRADAEIAGGGVKRSTVAAGKQAADGVVGDGVPEKSANRRDRGAYNAYQREYMRKRRAAARSA